MIDVVMPQMGESIVEGTITKWLKQVGDTVEKDEALFEISTDKGPQGCAVTARILRARPTCKQRRCAGILARLLKSTGVEAPVARTRARTILQARCRRLCVLSV